MDENPEEREARRFVEAVLGLTVTGVPSSVSKTPDFLVDGEPPGYVLEVKARFDDENSGRELSSGQIVSGSESLGWAPWAARIARSARHQFASGDPRHLRFWVMWFVVNRLLATETIFDQVIGTLYGVCQVAYWDEVEGKMHGRECLYVVPGVFERWPQIDAAIVTGRNAITLCVNELSDRAVAFQSSSLCKAFAQHGGPVSPTDLEANRGFWSVADRTIDRSKQETVQGYLSQRYKIENVYVLDVRNHYASAVVPRKRE